MMETIDGKTYHVLGETAVGGKRFFIVKLPHAVYVNGELVSICLIPSWRFKHTKEPGVESV